MAIVLIVARQYDRAIGVSREALNLDPGACLPLASLGEAYEFKEMFKEALDTYEAFNRCSGRQTLMDRIGIVYAKTGRKTDAENILREMEEECQHHYCRAIALSALYSWLGFKEKGIEFFEKAIDDRDPNLLFILNGPYVDAIASEPKFHALLEKINLK